MMQCVRRCSFICGAVLSLLLLLCSCQIGAGTGQFVQPPDIPPDDSSQGKTQLLSALNQEYFHRVQISNHFIQGSDSAAEAVFLYLAQNSGGDINKAVEFLAENPEDEYCRANCADAVLSRISPSSSKNLLGQLFLPLCRHSGGRCPERRCRVWPRCWKAHRQSESSGFVGFLSALRLPEIRLCRRRHRRSGARRGSVRFLTTFFKTSKNDRCGLLLRGGHFLCPPYWANHFILL